MHTCFLFVFFIYHHLRHNILKGYAGSVSSRSSSSKLSTASSLQTANTAFMKLSYCDGCRASKNVSFFLNSSAVELLILSSNLASDLITPDTLNRLICYVSYTSAHSSVSHHDDHWILLSNPSNFVIFHY